MAGYPGLLTRVTRVGLTKTSGWSSVAASTFFTASPPDEAANTLDDLTSSASGTSVAGSGAVTLDALVSAAAGAVGAKGTGANTLATVVSAGAGTAAGGSSAETLAALTSSASGVRGAAGSGAVTLATLVSAGAGLIPATGSAASTLDALVTVGTDAPAVQVIIFDDGTIPADFAWSSAGSGSVLDRPDAVGGTTKALRFVDIGDSQESYFEIYATARPGNNILTVRYEVSSESGYDYFRIYIDDVEVWEEAGVGAGWSEYSTALSVGSRTIKFRYSKDSSADEGDDTAYLSKITVSPIGPRPITAANTLEALTSQAEGETPDVAGWRYWRMVSLATQSISGTTGLGEVELRATSGGADLTGPGVGTASQTIGTPNGSYPAANAFDNNLATGWQSGSSFAALQYEFTNYPVEVAEISHKQVYRGEMLDMRVDKSKDGSTWETAAIKRGILTWPDSGLPPTYFVSGTETLINLTGPVRDYQGEIGVNSFGSTSTTVEFCPENKVAITGYSLPMPVVIERFIAFSATPLPSPPIGMTTYTFKIRGVVYNSDVSNVPDALIAVTAERTSVPNDWFELELSEPLVLAPGFYHFGVHVGGDSNGIWSHPTVGPEVSVKTLTEWPFEDGPPDPWPVEMWGYEEQDQPHPIYLIYPINEGASTLAALASEAVGFVGEDDAVTGTSAEVLEVLTSAGLGARGVMRPRQTLAGSYRPVKSLNATWVAR